MNIPYNVIRFIDIAYYTIILFMFAIIVNIIMDKYLPESEDLHKSHNIFMEFIKLSFMIGLLVIISYLGKLGVNKIPSPFENIYGFHSTYNTGFNDTGTLTGFILLTSRYVEQRIFNIRRFFDVLPTYDVA